MELRQLTPDDRPAHALLMAEAFDGGRRPAPAMAGTAPEPGDISPSVICGIFDGARLVAADTVHALHLTWDAGDAPMGGVAGVACVADQRGRGHVARLLAHSLRAMRESGQYLSGLYPFAWAFYRRHGWEWVGEKRHYTIPTAQILASPEGQHMRFYDGPEARAVVQPVYDAFARRYRGMTTRTDPAPRWWEKVLSHQDGKTTYVHVHEDPATGRADGYLTFRYGDGGTSSLGDFVALTPDAYRGLLSVLHYYGTQVEKITLSAPADDPLPLHVMHWDLKTKVNPLFMGRIVDVKAALEALRPAPAVTGRVRLQVADGQCDWNDGVFLVTVEGGNVSVAPASEEPGVTLDVQALTQAYWGQPSLDLLRRGGRAAVADEAQYALLSALLPPTVCYLQDFF